MSFGVWPRDHHMPLQRPTTGVCHALLRIPTQSGPLAVLRFPAQSGPFCTMWFKQFIKNVTKTGHTDGSHPQSTEHDTQPIAYQISKQAIPYGTCGGTRCPRGSTPKIWSLADSSMTSHNTWQNPYRLHHSNLAQATTSILTRVNSHLNGWETIPHKDTSQTQHHKGWKDLYDSHGCMAKHNYPVKPRS
jgi:hypothetical protein